MSALPADRPGLRRLGRYLVTSMVATVVSELTLIELYGRGVLGAGPAAVAANLAGTFPSYLMSRYWIWADADREGAGRQAASYWAVSIFSLAVSTAVVAAAGHYAPRGHTLHVAIVGIAYIGTYGVLWLGKFAVYQLFVFPAGCRDAPAEPGVRGAEGDVTDSAPPRLGAVGPGR